MVRRILLDLIYAVVGVVTAPLWMRKTRGDWRQRFGHPADDQPGERTGDPPRTEDTQRLLIHAVSVGEVNLTVPLVRALLAEPGRWSITLSVGTDTGIARARSLFAAMEGVQIERYPLDASWAVRRFLDRVRPEAVVLVELELWPNFLDACRRRGIPVGVVNGRLSERSFRGYRLLRPVLKRYFRSLTFAAVQDEAYAERFQAMGVPKDRLHVAGSMKWDSADLGVPEDAASELAEAMGIDRSRPLVVGGSTAPGEHELLVQAVEGTEAQILCAPRRPEWFDEAARVLGTATVRRSRPGEGDPSNGRFVLDTIGELRAAYALADIVVVGRSFGDLAGSDPMEPAALGKPVLIGPAHADFLDATQTLRQAGGLRVVEQDELADAIGALLRDEASRTRMGEAAAACVQSKAGATQRHVELIERYLNSGRSDA
ncbi:MAG: 3-deoxy-D-manno-octulosonic acid transferase [Phycisphaerales bacterium JB050]